MEETTQQPEIRKRGRKKGGKNRKTLEKEAVEKEFKQRIARNVDALFNAQFSLAVGVQYLYRIDTIMEGRREIKKHVLVSDPEEIREYLDNGLDGEDYYYITVEKPENNALSEMFSRYFGKPAQKVTGPDNPDGSEGGIQVVVAAYNASAPQIPPAQSYRVIDMPPQNDPPQLGATGGENTNTQSQSPNIEGPVINESPLKDGPVINESRIE